MKFKKSLCVILATSMTLTMFGCGSDTTTSTTSTGTSTSTADTSAPTPTDTNVDLGGIHVKIAQWGDESTLIENPIDDYEESVNARREQSMADYNFTFEWYNSGTWATMLERLSTGVIAGDPAGNIFRLGPAHIISAVDQNLLWDLNELDAFDLSDPNFHQLTSIKTTFGGGTYGYNIDATNTGDQYLYWNKRLFEEAGIDPDLPYTLQASGEWTWDALFEISDILTRDTTGDGVIDTYAHVQQGNVICKNFMISNNAVAVGVDADGKFYNNTLSSEIYEALLAAEKFIIDHSVNIAWDANANEVFMSGGAAMLTGQQWLVKQWSANMEDLIGCVMFPKGPNNTSDGYYSAVNMNTFAIPANLTKDEAEAVLTAHYHFLRLPEGYEDGTYSQFVPYYTDRQSVDETLKYANDDDFKVVEYEELFTDINMTDFNNLRWNESTVQAMLEEKQAIINTTLDNANK